MIRKHIISEKEQLDHKIKSEKMLWDTKIPERWVFKGVLDCMDPGIGNHPADYYFGMMVNFAKVGNSFYYS